MEFKSEIIDKNGREWDFIAEISGKVHESLDTDKPGVVVEDLEFEFIYLRFAEIVTKLVEINSLEENFEKQAMHELKMKAEMKLIEAWEDRAEDEHDLCGNGTEAL